MSAPQYEITPTFPMGYEEGHGYETIPEGGEIEVIKFHLKNIVLTNPGENLSDPNFGVGLKKYIFDLETSGNTNNLKQVILSQIQTYANYFTRLNVLVDLSKIYENTLTVRIEFQFGPDNITDHLEITATS